MIFTGTMRRMKLRLRRDDVIMDLQGNPRDIARISEQVVRIEGVDARLETGRTLVVQIADRRRRADALAEVLRLVDSANLVLEDVHCGQNETENAYLQLLQEDEAHGFQRFALDPRKADDAVAGDPPA